MSVGCLQDLFMPRNLLTTVPKDIGNLVNLRRVSFAGNKMKSLPSEVGDWTKVCLQQASSPCA